MELQSSNNEYIEMRFGPRWPYVSTIRNFMQNFLMVATNDQKLSNKISMTISELVENAVKYSDDDETFLKVHIHREEDKLEVAVKNHAREAQAASLFEFLKELESDPPLEAYIKRMKQINDQNISHLGLARIRYEAEANLTAEYADSFVCVRAWFSI